MIRVNMIVEGQTEEAFVQTLLTPYLGEYNIFVSVLSVETSRIKKKIYRGGLLKSQKFKNDLNRWMKEDRSAWYIISYIISGHNEN